MIRCRTTCLFLFLIPFLLLIVSALTASGTAGTQDKRVFTNSIGMKFVRIKPASFRMGSGLTPFEVEQKYGGEAKWYRDEIPCHQVTLTKSYYIQISEVTQAQWTRVMGFNPSFKKSCGKNCPVEKISWHDAQAFIKKLNKQEGTNKYRLPTEAEWEYACRAGGKSAFCFGGDKKALKAYAWYHANSWNWTHQVCLKASNAWGLYDMHGNVGEWCADWYGQYSAESVIDPKGPASGHQRVSRGGSWRSAGRFCRCAYRYGVDPAYRRPTGGFRLVKDL